MQNFVKLISWFIMWRQARLALFARLLLLVLYFRISNLIQIMGFHAFADELIRRRT
jgi:hypothetical protein